MRGDRTLYSEASREVRRVLETVSPSVEMASIDEAYIDVTGSQKLFGGDDAIASHIKKLIRERTSLPCTIAVAPNKLVAKVASDHAQPDGYLRFGAGEEEAFLAPLPIRKLPGLGPRTAETLACMGVHTLGELTKADLDMLRRRLGEHAESLQRRARGESDSAVIVSRVAKSIGRETTFVRDRREWESIEPVLVELMERALVALRVDGLQARTVTLKVRYAGFDTRTFSATLERPTCVDRDVFEALKKLLPKAKRHGRAVRLVGISLSQLGRGPVQLGMFEDVQSERWERALHEVDAIRVRHGFDTVRRGNALRSKRLE